MPSKRRKKSSAKKYKSKNKGNTVKELDETSRKFMGSFSPTNISEQKERFLKYGLTPEFSYSKGRDAAEVERQMTQHARNAIRTDYFHHARAILDKVKAEYKDASNFIELMYGQPITQKEATDYIEQYIEEHDLVGQITIYWSSTLTGSAKMCWRGPVAKVNKPEQRNFSLVVKSTPDNKFLSETGIKCLMNHEIGTHYFRAYNDGYQPWYTDRKKFGLHGYRSRNCVSSEEGLACLNTIINAKSKYLWGSALSYYTSCMAAELTFEELFEHLEQYVSSKEHRWKLCLRTKRAMSNTDCCGGIGHDQVYFEGAANILSNIDDIDLAVMFSGRVCYDETTRTKRLARTDCLRLPAFVKDIDRYKYILKFIAYINGFGDKPIVPLPKNVLNGDTKFDYVTYKQRRDGKSKKKAELEDTPFMCFSSNDSPVPKRPKTSYARKIASVQQNDNSLLSARKEFIYPISPVPDAHYVRLRDMLYPDLNLDLDTTRSVTKIDISRGANKLDTSLNVEASRNWSKVPYIASISERTEKKKSLPELFSVTDRQWHKPSYSNA